MNSQPTRLLLDFGEVGGYLNVGRTTVYKLVANGDLVAVKIGKRSLITAESVEAYVGRLTAGAMDGVLDDAS